MFPYLSGCFPLVLLVLLLGMGTGVSGEDTEYEVSELGSDAKTLSSGLSLTVIAEGLSPFVEGIEGVIGVLSSRYGMLELNWLSVLLINLGTFTLDKDGSKEEVKFSIVESDVVVWEVRESIDLIITTV